MTKEDRLFYNKSVVLANTATRADASINCFIQNAFELLDKPGEYYFNRKTNKLYYYPEEGESTDSEFVIPDSEMAMFIMGDTTEKRVENITFEGLKFEHFSRPTDYEIYSSGQGPQLCYGNDATVENDFGTIYINRARNINFYNNVFTGLGMTAINMKDAVSDCEVIGNAFYDISKGAIEIGSVFHIYDDPDVRGADKAYEFYIPENPKTDYYMQLLEPYITASSNSTDRTNVSIQGNVGRFSMRSWNSTKTTSVEDYTDVETYGTMQKSWSSDLKASLRGERAWIKYDFVRKYTISEIMLVFDPETVPEEQRSNYEVLVSNDPNFGEGNYKTIATVTEPSDKYVDFKSDDTEKYRYVMIRKLDNEQFTIHHVYMYTPDIEHQIVREKCRNINFSNNYVTRTGDNEYSNVAVFTFACEDATFSHNELSYVPYSTFSFGLSWGYYGKCGRFDLTDNYIHNTNGLGYDGGAIYTLGGNEGENNTRSKIARNYLRNTNAAFGLYIDNGSYGETIFDHVDEMTGRTIMHNSGAQNNEVFDYYSTRINNAQYSTYEIAFNGKQETYSIGDEPDRVMELKLKAGLEPEYKYLHDIVPSAEPSYSDYDGMNSNCRVTTERRPDYHSSVVTAIGNMIKDAEFGYEYGQFPITTEYMLRNYEKYTVDSANSAVEVSEILETAIASQKRLPLDELITLAEEKLLKTKAVSSIALLKSADDQE